MEETGNGHGLFTPDEKLQDKKPVPVSDRTYFVFNDLKKGQVKQGSFIIRNIGGPFKNIDISVPDEEKFLEIIDSKPLSEEQTGRLPLKITFKARAASWSKSYTNTIIVRLDGQDERIVVDLDTQTKPVNDFVKIFSPAEIKKMTALIQRLEKSTTAEIAVVAVDYLEGKTIEKYANDLFNEWGIGKENIHNGVLFILNPRDHEFRVEVGLGLENLITREFIQEISEKYARKYFSSKKFGKGTYLILSEIFAEIYRKYSKK